MLKKITHLSTITNTNGFKLNVKCNIKKKHRLHLKCILENKWNDCAM